MPLLHQYITDAAFNYRHFKGTPASHREPERWHTFNEHQFNGYSLDIFFQCVVWLIIYCTRFTPRSEEKQGFLHWCLRGSLSHILALLKNTWTYLYLSSFLFLSFSPTEAVIIVLILFHIYSSSLVHLALTQILQLKPHLSWSVQLPPKSWIYSTLAANAGIKLSLAEVPWQHGLMLHLQAASPAHTKSLP